MKNNGLKNSKAITLIAMVVTIIVLLILAGVSIAVLTGENGIINRTTSAKKTTEEAEAQEKLQLELEALKIDYYKSGPNGTFAEYLQSREADLKTALGDNTLKVENGKITYGGYDYTVDGQGNITGKSLAAIPVELTTQTTTQYSEWTILNNMPTDGGFDGKVNMPKLGSELKAVVLTSDLPNTVQNNKVSQEDVTWYDYIDQGKDANDNPIDGKTSKWGNAVTTDSSGEITGFYVWIPRFAYKITKGYHGNGLTYVSGGSFAGPYYKTSEMGTIEVKFLKDTTNEFADGSNEILVSDPSQVTYTDEGEQEQWLVHPAFLSNANNGGGFGIKNARDDGISGIWISKFEASAFVGETPSNERNISTLASSGSKIDLCSLPSQVPVAEAYIGDVYDLCLNMNYSLKSHLLKNSEWGAVVYLASSEYGRNGSGISSENGVYFTGGSALGTRDYLNNGTQSSTGNTYGVYGLGGVSSEFVASYKSFPEDKLNYGGKMTETNIEENINVETSSKYKTVYDAESYDGLLYSKGDSLYETSCRSGWVSAWLNGSSNFGPGLLIRACQFGFYNRSVDDKNWPGCEFHVCLVTE